MTADCAAPSDEDLDYLHERRHKLTYCVKLSTQYHLRRERWFDMLDKLTKAVSVIGGSAVLAKVTTPDALMWAAAVITIASTLSLVFGYSERARRHADLARTFRTLLAKIEKKGERDFTEADLNDWWSEHRTAESGEPPPINWVVGRVQKQLALAAGEQSKSSA